MVASDLTTATAQTAVCDIGAFEQHGACDDADGDGYGSTGNPVCPSGSLPDCDNSNADVYPGAPQICDGLNNDCGHASWPALAGTNEADDDGDGASECQGDCNDADLDLWGPPSEVRNLIVLADGETLSWSAPLDYGGTAVSIVYDTLRSQDPASFDGAVCVETDDGSDTEALDATIPDAGFVNHYLVRAENVCSAGTLGAASGGEERTGGSCP